MSSTQPISYTDKIRQFNRQKSGILLRAQRLQRSGEIDGKASMLFSKAAKIEMQIAQLLEDTEHENAIVHWVSAASCYMQARNYHIALELFDRILAQPISPQLRRDVEQFRSRCHTRLRSESKTL